ncbi:MULTISPECIES: hypothetical protein [unclassified Kitasatospora]
MTAQTAEAVDEALWGLVCDDPAAAEQLARVIDAHHRLTDAL